LRRAAFFRGFFLATGRCGRRRFGALSPTIFRASSTCVNYHSWPSPSSASKRAARCTLLV
jgi:hypothetical protein